MVSASLSGTLEMVKVSVVSWRIITVTPALAPGSNPELKLIWSFAASIVNSVVRTPSINTSSSSAATIAVANVNWLVEDVVINRSTVASRISTRTWLPSDAVPTVKPTVSLVVFATYWSGSRAMLSTKTLTSSAGMRWSPGLRSVANSSSLS